MTAIFNASSFPAIINYDTPRVGATPASGATNLTDPVTIQLSDGQNVVVFDTKQTALRCLRFMHTRNQWLIQASDDVMVVNCGGAKIMILETTLINQKLITSFSPTYQGGCVLFSHRSLSQMLELDEALQAVGFCKHVEARFMNNDDLKNSANPTRIQLVDYFFRATLTGIEKGSKLEDEDPICYDYTV